MESKNGEENGEKSEAKTELKSELKSEEMNGVKEEVKKVKSNLEKQKLFIAGRTWQLLICRKHLLKLANITPNWSLLQKDELKIEEYKNLIMHEPIHYSKGCGRKAIKVSMKRKNG